MAASYESKVIATYLSNLMARTSRRSAIADKLVTWLCDLGPQIGCPFEIKEGEEETVARSRQERGKPVSRTIVSAENWQVAMDVVQAASRRKHRSLVFDRNLNLLVDHFGLDKIEQDILDIACRYARHSPMETLWDDIAPGYPGGAVALLAHFLNVPTPTLDARLAPTGRLRRLGLVSWGLRSATNPPDPVEGLVGALAPASRSFDDICGRLIGPVTAPACSWADFDHLGEERDLVTRIIKGALAKRAKGINILLYGPPGTGKTEFCKALAARVGAVLHAVGEVDDRGGEPVRSERVASLVLSQQLLASRRNTMVLFDEMEDVLEGGTNRLLAMFGGRPRAGSKVYLNRLLEEAAVPTLWTSNSLRSFDPALLRRITLAIEIRTPPAGVRERVWKDTLDRERLRVDPSLARRLAQEFAVPPALAANAVRAAKLAGGTDKDLRLALRSVTKAMAGGVEPLPQSKHEAAFSLDLANADHRLQPLADRFVNLGSDKAVSLCLFGPPGTGKSAFVRHLAERMDMPVLQKRASDLISMWLGESEANIAAAFAEARADGAFLVFDEADSLLADRAGAQRSWEISQVNEMLTWMESHELPFACTTNLMDRLDPASLRRFTFKIRFGFLDRGQVQDAFSRFFGLTAPARVCDMDMLTPGDFAVVRRRAGLLGFADDTNEIANALAQEIAAKPQASKPIGFRTASA